MGQTFDFVSLDFPDNTHLIGASYRNEVYKEFYKGFLWSFRLFNGEQNLEF
jgi:hypothetical protein